MLPTNQAVPASTLEACLGGGLARLHAGWPRLAASEILFDFWTSPGVVEKLWNMVADTQATEWTHTRRLTHDCSLATCHVPHQAPLHHLRGTSRFCVYIKAYTLSLDSSIDFICIAQFKTWTRGGQEIMQ